MSTMKDGKRHTSDKSRLPVALRQCDWQVIERDMHWGDGDCLLVAVPICIDSQNPEKGFYYEMSIVDIRCDEDYFAVSCNGDGWGWDLDDADFFLTLNSP